MNRRLRRAFAVSTTLAIGLLGCELIVSSTVPDFRCTPGVPGACPDGMTCEPGSSVCTSGLTTEGGPVEASPGRDADKDAPVDPPGVAKVGEPCNDEKACGSNLFCATSSPLTTDVVASTQTICTKPCCTSEECSAGFVCYGAGTGGNYCVAAARVQRMALGMKATGGACNESDECRSGVCVDGLCLDTCCGEMDCAGDTVCRAKTIKTLSDRETWVCARSEKDASLPNNRRCDQTVERCKNDNCSGFPQKCRPACCTSGECVALDAGFAFCGYGRFDTTNSQTKWCFDKNDAMAGQRGLGAECSGDGDCSHRFCDPDSKKCTAICCRDEDCAQGEACRPAATGTPFLRCVRADTGVPQ